MAAKQPKVFFLFFFYYCYTTTPVPQLYLAVLKASFFFLNSLHLLLPFIASSVYPTESHRSCLPDQNGCVCRGREKEGMRGRQRCWGVREMRRGAAEWRRAVVMSHLLQADRTAKEKLAWATEPGGEGRWGQTRNAWEGKDLLSKLTRMCEK